MGWGTSFWVWNAWQDRQRLAWSRLKGSGWLSFGNKYKPHKEENQAFAYSSDWKSVPQLASDSLTFSVDLGWYIAGLWIVHKFIQCMCNSWASVGTAHSPRNVRTMFVQCSCNVRAMFVQWPKELLQCRTIYRSSSYGIVRTFGHCTNIVPPFYKYCTLGLCVSEINWFTYS